MVRDNTVAMLMDSAACVAGLCLSKSAERPGLLLSSFPVSPGPQHVVPEPVDRAMLNSRRKFLGVCVVRLVGEGSDPSPTAWGCLPRPISACSLQGTRTKQMLRWSCQRSNSGVKEIATKDL